MGDLAPYSDGGGDSGGCLETIFVLGMMAVGGMIAALDGPPPYPPVPPAAAPVAQVAAVGPLPDLQPALPAPVEAPTATPVATPVPTDTPTAAPTEQPTNAPTGGPTSQPTPPPTHPPTPPPPTPPSCTESFSSTITYNDASGSHSLTSSNGTWSFNEPQADGQHPASATISSFTACGHDHFVFTITDNAGNSACNPGQQPPLTTPAQAGHFKPIASNITITGHFGSGC